MLKSSTSTLAIMAAAGMAGLVTATSTASADKYERRGYAPAACCFSWTGFYYGINAGYGFSAEDDTVTVFETINGIHAVPGGAIDNFGSRDIAGPFGGGQVGFNYQVGSWVFGLEADVQGGDISDRSTGAVTDYLPGLDARVDTRVAVGWFGTLRPRIGFAWDRTMVYATGGFAWAGVKHSLQFRDNFNFRATDSSSTSRTGYVVGGGIEHAFSCCWSLKLEYQYVNVESEHHVAPLLFAPTGPGGIPTAFAEHSDSHVDFHTVRLGLNWKWHDRRDKPMK